MKVYLMQHALAYSSEEDQERPLSPAGIDQAKAAAKGVPKGAPKGVPKDVPKGGPKGVPEGVPKRVPKNVHTKNIARKWFC